MPVSSRAIRTAPPPCGSSQERGPEGPEAHAFLARIAEKRARGTELTYEDLAAPAAFSRRYEAQADGIAQQMLVAAGYPVATARRGTEDLFGCRKSIVFTSHPAADRRLLNASFGQELIAKHARAAAVDGSVAFDGGTPRGGGAAVSARSAPFNPAVKISDYDEKGTLKVGRLVVSDLRVPPPPSDAGAARAFGQSVAASFVDYWIAEPFAAAVDGLMNDSPATEKVLAACGTPRLAEISKDASLWTWTKRLAREGVRRLSQ